MEQIKGTDLTEVIKTGAQMTEERMKAQVKPEIVEIYGIPHYRDLHGDMVPVGKPEPDAGVMPQTFQTFTLQGLVDWIKADVDKLFTQDKPAALVSVASPHKVVVYGPLTGDAMQRPMLANCSYAAPDIPLEAFVDAETLAITMQATFKQDEARDAVLGVMSNLSEQQSAQTSDDGFSQRVTIKSGVQEIDSKVFKNPAPLRPMRTFPEVEQPVSPFVVRFKEGKKAALFNADGGAWKVAAVKSIGSFLRKALEGTNTVVIA